MANKKFWLLEWIDDHDVKTLSDAEALLSDDATLDGISAYAQAWSEGNQDPSSGESIVAGRGLDFSGHLDCNSPECRRKQVDSLFQKAWHYFDRIIVADSISYVVMNHWDSPSLDRKKWILRDMAAILYLTEIGAADLVEFRAKNPPCVEHLRYHSEQADIEHVLELGDQLMPKILTDASVEIHQEPGEGISWAFSHPQFEHTQWGKLASTEVKGKSKDELRVLIYHSVFNWFVANLNSDVAMARSSGVPLGSTIWLHQRLLLGTTEEIQPAQVAFNISLPVLEGITTKELIEIRQEEKGHFDQFRYNLRLAISERLKLSEANQPAKIAREIQTDLIEPELAKIRVRLEAAQVVLAQKAVSNLAIGILGTVVGSFFGVPIAGAAIGGALSVGPLHSYFDAVKDIKQSDMFFLWKTVHGHM